MSPSSKILRSNKHITRHRVCPWCLIYRFLSILSHKGTYGSSEIYLFSGESTIKDRLNNIWQKDLKDIFLTFSLNFFTIAIMPVTPTSPSPRSWISRNNYVSRDPPQYYMCRSQDLLNVYQVRLWLLCRHRTAISSM